MRVGLTVNGERRQADDVWEGESLLYVLRERLGLPGSKNACEQGECGSCSVRSASIVTTAQPSTTVQVIATAPQRGGRRR